jgi:integrase/recombinase XerD
LASDHIGSKLNNSTPLILAFLEHIEADRGNSARTRNARLAAINAFFRFLEYRLPSCLDQASRIHAIPMKKTDEALVGYLSRNELQAPQRSGPTNPVGHP